MTRRIARRLVSPRLVSPAVLCAVLWAVLAAALSACGGPSTPEEEETASWTSGDDAPLEGDE
jgi:hypothetical protein